MLREIKQGKGLRVTGIRRQLLTCFISAVLLYLSFPKSNLEFLAWFSFVPLFAVLKNKSKIKAFLLAYFTGVVFWLGTIYWLIHVTGIGLIVLVLYLALYFAVFGLIISSIKNRASSIKILFIPASWVVLEYIRSYLFTGFPWGLLGYSQYQNLPVIQIADITGVWGVSFLVMMVNVALNSILDSRCSILEKIKRLLLPLLIVLFVLVYGYFGIHRKSSIQHPVSLKISVIQGNIPQELKWNPKAKNFILNKYLELTLQAKEENPDLIVWPEASFPGFPSEEKEQFLRLSYFVEDLQTPLLLGAVTAESDRYYNSALFISGEGKLLGQYNKIHLVPFGEYIPLKMVFGFMENIVPVGAFNFGKSYTVFTPFLTKQMESSRARFSTLICFEDLFPELSRKFVSGGAQFLVNITNDAWFQESSAPYQHLQASVFRAVENRVPLVRSANTGVSGFISSKGEIIKLVRVDSKNIFVDGFAVQNITISGKKLTFYTRYGDIFVLVCFIYLIFVLIETRESTNLNSGKNA